MNKNRRPFDVITGADSEHESSRRDRDGRGKHGDLEISGGTHRVLNDGGSGHGPGTPGGHRNVP